MPSRQPGLPEGTDHIIDTNIDLGETGTGAGGGGKGLQSREGAAKKGAPAAFQFDKASDGAENGDGAGGIAGQVREQISSLTSQAGEKARTYADDGKARATSLLESIAQIVADASGSVEERLGDKYAGVGHRASDSIKSLASTLDQRSIDDLLDDARAFVQRSPAIAIGIAAILGFAVARVVRSSVSEYRGGGETGTGGSSGGAGNDPAA